MKAAFALVLIMLVLLLSIPMGVGDMKPCPACVGDGPLDVWTACLAIVALAALALPGRGLFSGGLLPRAGLLLLPFSLDRPPRFP